MVLHIGDDHVVPIEDVVAIMDYETANRNEATRMFFDTAHQRGAVVQISKQTLKSFVLTKGNNGEVVYCSPISAGTLYKRANLMYELNLHLDTVRIKK